MSRAVVTIVGRPNVGKSTFFNRIIRKRDAIVDDISGVTRDRKYAIADWSGVEFTLIDTGGYFPGTEDKIGRAVLRQVDKSIDEADVIIFMVDAKTGITPLDQEIASSLKRIKKPLIVAVNKADNPRDEYTVGEFYKLGLGEPVPFASANGRNVGDFLDKILECIPPEKRLPESDEAVFGDDRLRLAIVGRPNAGKSSLVNSLLGEEKMIVTDIPGTTRDSNDTILKYHGEEIVLVDTAGLRRKAKVQDRLEYFSTVRTHETIRKCHVAIIMIDALEGLADQDIRIINEVVRFNKGVILAVNKWDLVEKDANTAKEMEAELKETLKTLDYLPVVFISATEKKRIYKLIDLARQIYEERGRTISTSRLNRFLEEIIAKYPPPSNDRKEVKIKYITQVKSQPPVFALFANHPGSIKANYRRYLENQFRNNFSFTGVPLTFVFKQK